MSQAEKRVRSVPGAEVFFGESVAQYLADLSDEAYATETAAEGLLLGKLYSDDRGSYCIVSGVSQDLSGISNAVGWFRSAEGGSSVDQSDIRKVRSLFGYAKTYVIAVDCGRGEMATYSVENGVARKVPSAMVENL